MCVYNYIYTYIYIYIIYIQAKVRNANILSICCMFWGQEGSQNLWSTVKKQGGPEGHDNVVNFILIGPKENSLECFQ